MKRPTPALVPRSPSLPTTPARGSLAPYVCVGVQQAYIHGESSVKAAFDPGALRPQSRDLTTRTPWKEFEIFISLLLHVKKDSF
ncbi:hypothetical protein AVEN_248321-1 [Araneus ventricosus]|uniref:Uncharacterized protein n=1 Tax=Araneus ventricosus TaxID=182803 RepID=A0A4Y1ZUB1_ARAVE|nr:hypothetical protein AVEN_248321-1 [Araneus ventricosus]